MDLEAINAWHHCFENSIGADIFEIVESAIMVAAWFRPDEFFQRRDRIAEILYAKQKPVSFRRAYYANQVFEDLRHRRNSSVISSSDINDEDPTTSLMDDSINGFSPFEQNYYEVPQKKKIEENFSNRVDVVGDGQEKPRHVIKLKLKRNKEAQLPATEEEKEEIVQKKSRDRMVAAIEDSNREKQLPVSEEEEILKVSTDCKISAAGNGEDKKSTFFYKKEVRNSKGRDCSMTTCDKAEQFPVPTKEVLNCGAESPKNKSDSGVKGKEGKSVFLYKEEALELKFEATKRKFKQEYNQFESAKKKIRMIDFKDLPPQQQKQGLGCNNNRSKLAQRFQKSIVA